MIEKILLAVDGSQNAQRAINVAAELAEKLNAELSIVHVLMHDRPSEELVRVRASTSSAELSSLPRHLRPRS